MYYMLIGVIIVMVIGTATSFIFGASDIDDMDTKLFVPPIERLLEKRRKRKRPYSQRRDITIEEISMLNRREDKR